MLSSVLRHFHTVDYDGYITPSVACPKKGCDFHQWLHLENWVPEGIEVA
jgi:hypothetical protein